MLVQGTAGTVGTTTGPQGLPWPTGDPGELRVSAQHAAGLADELDRRHNELLTTGRNIDSWQGTAHAAYASDLERNAAAVESVAEAFRTLRDALIDLARILDQAQEVVRQQARRLADAREQAERASARAQNARAEAEAASRRAEAAAPAAAMTGGTDPATQEAQAAAESARSAEAEAAEAREYAEWMEQRATALVEQEITDVRLIDGRCAALISHAAQTAQAALAKAGASAQGYNGLNSLGSFFTLFGPIGLTAFGAGGALPARRGQAIPWSLFSVFNGFVDRGQTSVRGPDAGVEVSGPQGSSLGEFTAYAMLGSAMAKGSLRRGKLTLTGKARGSVGAKATAKGSTTNGLSGMAKVRAGARASARGGVDYGMVGGHARGEASGGAEAGAHASVGLQGIDVGATARAGGAASVSGGVDVGPVSLSGTAEGWAGPGVEAGAEFGMGEDGKFHIGTEVGASPLVGGKLGYEITVDPDPVVEAAGDAAGAIGDAAEWVGDKVVPGE